MIRYHPIVWLREHPFGADAIFAVATAIVAVVFHLTLHMDEASDPSVWGVALAIGATLPLAWRRRSPAVVLVVVTSTPPLSKGAKSATGRKLTDSR